LIKNLGFDGPVVLMGLSYGGGLALQMAADYPDQVAAAVLAAPYVVPLPDQDNQIRQMIKLSRQLNPTLQSVPDNDLYDLILRGMVVSTYPLIEPEITKWRPPFQAFAASELVRGIRHLSYRELLKKLRVPLHLVIAEHDSYIPRKKLEEFWSSVPLPVRGSFLEIQGVEHKINESVGPFLAAWVWELTTNDSYLTRPGRFLGEPERGFVTEVGGFRVVQMPKTNPCETWLSDTGIHPPVDRIRRDPVAALKSMIESANPLPGSL
jgi:hypothetical protein